MPRERSNVQKATIVSQTILQNPMVRASLAVIFFAIFYLIFDFPWIVLLVLAAVIYFALGWISQREVEKPVDHDAEARAHFLKVATSAHSQAQAISTNPQAKVLALRVAESSRSLLSSANTPEKLRLCSRYFQTIEDLYLPNLKTYVQMGNRLDDTTRRQFEEIVLPKVVEQAKELENDMYQDERISFAARTDMLASELGMLPELDLTLPDSTESATPDRSAAQ